MRDWDDILGVLAIGFVVLMIAGGIIGFARVGYVQSKCLEMGYAEYDVTLTLKGYCIQRDYRGTMFSVPLAKATPQTRS